MDKMMKAMSKCVEEMVLQLSTKYGFDKAEALEFIMPAGETVRGRPSKPKKKVVNKTEMVEDVIMSIMEEVGAPLSNPALEAVTAQAEPVIVASEGGLKGDTPLVETPLKKKAAPKKKKAEATVVEAVALVAPDTVAALIAVESTNEAQAEPVIVTSESGVTAYTMEEGEKTAKAVAALMEATKEDAKQKKKAAPKKKKAEAEAVVAQAEPVTVAAEGGVKGDAPLVEEAPKEKKKAAPKKKKAEAVTEVAQAEPVIVAAVVEEAPKEKKKAAPKKKKAEAEVAVVAQAEPVTVAAVVVEDAPKEKKKAAPKKKKAEAEAAVVEVVAQAEPVTVAAVVEAPKEKKKAAPKKKAEAPVVVVEAPKPVVVVEAAKPVVSPLELSADEEEGGDLGGSPPTPSEDDESTSVAEWTCKKDGKTYLKSCEDNCGEDTCDCAGEVYDPESQEVIGHWNGETIEAPAWQAGDD